jgi:acyl dehydratase
MGEKKLSYEDVQVGDEAPVVSHTLTRTDLVKYAGASGDFNPMHHDEVAAQQAGQPSVFGHGMFSMGLLGTALTDYVGVGNVTRYQVRFARQTWPDEVLSSKIVVTAKRQEDGKKLLDLAVTLSNAVGAAGFSAAPARYPDGRRPFPWLQKDRDLSDPRRKAPCPLTMSNSRGRYVPPSSPSPTSIDRSRSTRSSDRST